MRALLEAYRRGEMDLEEALRRLDRDPVQELGFARLDHHRALRLGHPETVYCPGKGMKRLVAICRGLARRGEGFLATRAEPAQLERLAEEFEGLEVSRAGRIAHLPAERPESPPVVGPVLILTGGTADRPVAEEARVTAAALGNPVRVEEDVGVAGLHRVLGLREELGRAAVVIVVAGMDGALPSVVGGLVATPVIAVPTSVGYGAGAGGIAPLLTMLNACAPGVVVVNVDNGFGAAFAATRINQGVAGGSRTL